MRFTLRDLFWLTLLCAACCGWWTTYRAGLNVERERDEALREWMLGIAGHELEARQPAAVQETAENP